MPRAAVAVWVAFALALGAVVGYGVGSHSTKTVVKHHQVQHLYGTTR